MMRAHSMRRLRRSSRLDAMSGAGEDVRHVAPGSTVSTSRSSTSHSIGHYIDCMTMSCRYRHTRPERAPRPIEEFVADSYGELFRANHVDKLRSVVRQFDGTGYQKVNGTIGNVAPGIYRQRCELIKIEMTDISQRANQSLPRVIRHDASPFRIGAFMLQPMFHRSQEHGHEPGIRLLRHGLAPSSRRHCGLGTGLEQAVLQDTEVSRGQRQSIFMQQIEQMVKTLNRRSFESVQDQFVTLVIG